MFLSNRSLPALALGIACVVLFVAESASAQSAESEPYIGVIKGADVYVRCGAAESYYPFAKVNAGDLVKVTGEKFDWVRIATVGPAFKHAFGYVKHVKDDASRFRLATDRRSGVTLGRIEIIAPNLDARNDPKDSWKSILRLEAEKTLSVLETIHTDKDAIHKVALPEAAAGWISKAYIEPASTAQVEQWEQTLSAQPEIAKPTRARGEQSDESAGSVKRADLPARADDHGPLNDESPESTEPVAPEPGTPEIEPAEPALPTLDDLEAAYKLLQKEQIETAEVGPLRQLYLELAERSAAEPRVLRYAKGRAEQLEIWADLQKKRQELDAVRARTKLTADEAEAVRKALESSEQYTAVGRVAASTIYDGQRLPKLLRLQDSATSRTIAYLQPDEQYELVNLIGNLIGIVGDKTFDETLRLNVIAPRRIDILTPESRESPAAAPSDGK